MLHVPQDISAKVLSHNFPLAENFFVAIILYKKKWLTNCSSNPNYNNMKNHLEAISKTLDAFSTKYENILLLDDFNACADDEIIKYFCSSYCLKSLSNNQHVLKVLRTRAALMFSMFSEHVCYRGRIT